MSSCGADPPPTADAALLSCLGIATGTAALLGDGTGDGVGMGEGGAEACGADGCGAGGVRAVGAAIMNLTALIAVPVEALTPTATYVGGTFEQERLNGTAVVSLLRFGPTPRKLAIHRLAFVYPLLTSGQVYPACDCSVLLLW